MIKCVPTDPLIVEKYGFKEEPILKSLPYENVVLPVLHCKLGVTNLMKDSLKGLIPEVLPTGYMMRCDEEKRLSQEFLEIINAESVLIKQDQESNSGHLQTKNEERVRTHWSRCMQKRKKKNCAAKLEIIQSF